MSSITIHIKNMAGEMTSLVVPKGTKVEEVAHHLTEMNKTQFPYFRTKVMRMEEEKEEVVMEGEELVSFVSEKVEVEKISLEDSERPLTRLVLPMGREALYIYPMSRYVANLGGRVICCRVEHYIPSSAQCPTPSYRYQNNQPYLATAVRSLVPTISASHMEEIHEIVRQYYRELDPQNKENFHLEYPPSEVYKCGCGSVITGSSTASHIKTKKHQAYLESLKQ